MNLPKDPIILLSFINTHLRNHYSSLEDLCKSYGISQEELTKTLATINYHYKPEKNQFI